MYLKREAAYQRNKKKVYTIVLGQCTPSLLTGIKSATDFTTKDKAKDSIWLMKLVKKLSVGIDESENELCTIFQIKKRLYSNYQKPTESNDDFFDRFDEEWNTCEVAAGKESMIPKITFTSEKYKNMTDDQIEEATKAMYLFLMSDKIRYGNKVREISEGVVLGTDKFPETREATYRILADTQRRLDEERIRRGNVGTWNRNIGSSHYGNNNNVRGGTTSPRNRDNLPTIPEGARLVLGNDRRIYTAQCYNCQEWGHFSDQCPESNQGNNNRVSTHTSSTTSNHFKCFNKTCKTKHNISYILDTGSTHNTVKDKTHITNLTNLFNKDILHMESTTGDFLKYRQKGTHSIFDVETFYNRNTAANILAFHTLNNLENAYMYYDGRMADCFRLIYRDGREIQFKNNGRGLYLYTDPQNNEQYGPVPPPQSFVQYLQTVNGNEKLFTKKEIERAKAAVELQEFLAWPSTLEYLEIIRSNSLKNCDVTVDDIKRSVILYGEPVPYLQGRMTRKRPLRDDPLSRLLSPLPLELHEKRIELYVDIFHFQKCQFLLMESGRIKYVEIKDVFNQKMENLVRMVVQEIKKYHARGLQVSGVHVDNQFCNDEFENAIKPAILIPYAAREHVSVAERRNRTVKERMRSLVAGVPFKALPKIMVRGAARKAKQMINKFPAKNGVSTTISPEEIVEGKPKMDLNLRTISYGQYAQIHDGTDNTSKQRSVPAIALYQKNEREGFAFMSLETGCITHSNVWTQLPITHEVIERVESIAKEMIEVDDLLQDIDAHLNDVVLRQIQRQEDVTQTEIEEENNNNDQDEDVIQYQQYNENDEEIQREIVQPPAQFNQPQELIDIPIVEPGNSIDETSLDVSHVEAVEDEHEMSNLNDDYTDSEMSETESNNALQVDPDTSDCHDKLQHDRAIEQLIRNDNKNSREKHIRLEEEIREEENPKEKIPPITQRKIREEENQKEPVSKKTRTKSPPIPTRRQPKREIRSRDEYRSSQYPGSLHQQEVTLGEIVKRQINIGTQNFQKRARYDRGYRSLRGKYVQATNFLAKQLKSPKINKRNQTEFSLCVNTCFAQQMSAKKGFRELGERAIVAMMKELMQLDQGAMRGKPVVVEINPDILTVEEKKKALDAVNLIELKRDGRVKARSCANGSKQRMYLKEYDSVASPTVTLEGIFTTLLIGAYEGRKFISFDIPGAFLQAEMAEDKLVLLKMYGRIAEMMCEVNPGYRKHLRQENGKTVLYMKVIRAIYGCIESALQWYKMFTEKLQKEGFKLNPYDKCIANKVINNKQCTIAWHVDDCITSHVDKEVLKTISDIMQNEFGEMKITEGNEHDFLGMKIIINNDRTITIDMKDQIRKTIDFFEQHDSSVDSMTVTPAAHYLFNVNEEAEQLGKEQSEIFHSTTAKLLYIMQRARPDIETAVSFLMKRVSKSNIEDWKKLRRVIGFLKGTVDELRVIGATSLSEILTFIDSAYAVHANMRSHTGGLSSFGIGAVHARSKSSKINVKSSTESELVSTSEYLPHTLWLRHFMIGQGYEIKENTIYQDNKSAILMEVNGRNSCTGNSRHINIRYFWVKDRIDNKEVRIEYIPTHLMLADFFTKPLQGEKFRILRAFIMGWLPMSDLLIEKNDKNNGRIKEDVGNLKKK